MAASPIQFSSVTQSCLTLFDLMGQTSLSFTISWSLFKLMSIESVMPLNHLILCCPLLLLPSIFPSIRVFSNEPVLHIRWPKYWSFSISPFNEYLTVWIIMNCGKLLKRWEYQTILPVSWETCMWVKKQQLEPCMEHLIGLRLRKEYGRVVCCQPVCLIYMPSIS